MKTFSDEDNWYLLLIYFPKSLPHSISSLTYCFFLETSKLHIVIVTVLLPLHLMDESFGIWKLISLVILVLQFEFTSCRVQLIIDDIEIQELEHGRRRTKICGIP
ncbi:hypothetical protein ACP275_12G049300 [Erythranthe tilingii]